MVETTPLDKKVGDMLGSEDETHRRGGGLRRRLWRTGKPIKITQTATTTSPPGSPRGTTDQDGGLNKRTP